MIKIDIIAIGKDKDKWITEGQKHYEKLLSRYAKVKIVHIPAPKNSPSLSPNEIKKQEALLFPRHLESTRYIALSDKGEKFDSTTFAKKVEKLATSSNGRLTFVIGGAYGLDDNIIQDADFTLSLSPMTFSHQIVRLVLLEQLYRGFSILHNTDYHK